jgi:hypothetical protein
MTRTGLLSPAQMRVLLRETFSRDPEASLLVEFTRRISDPYPAAMPNAEVRALPHRWWVTLCIFAFLAVGIFCVFTWWGN